MILPVENKRQVMHINGINSDIIATLEAQYLPAVEQVRSIAEKFRGHTVEETARNVWHYLRHRCRYQKDEPQQQDILLPNRVIDACNRGKASGDCKSFALFANSIFGALGLRCGFRYASYDRYNPTPSHVYSYVLKNDGTAVICDGVYKRFNAEAAYQYKYDHPMQISVLSGLNGPSMITREMRQRMPVKLEVLLTKVKPGGLLHVVVSNAIHRKQGTAMQRGYTPLQLQLYIKQLEHILRTVRPDGALARIIKAEITTAQTPGFTGDLWHRANTAAIRDIQEKVAMTGIYGDDSPLEGFSLKKVFKGVKKALKQVSIKNALKGIKAVTFLPMRKAFQGLVLVNFRGIASRLKAHPKTKSKVLALWSDKFGGSSGKLNAAISKGATNKPLLGGAIKGHDDELSAALSGLHGPGIGIAPMAAAGIVAAATPILLKVLKLLKLDGAPEVPGAEGSTEAIDAAHGFSAESLLDKAENFIQKALPSAQSTGVIPEPPRSDAEMQAEKNLPADLETSGGASFDMASVGKFALPALAIGVGLYALNKKK